jgi:hypothetical protein
MMMDAWLCVDVLILTVTWCYTTDIECFKYSPLLLVQTEWSLENQQFVIKHCRSFYIQAILEIQKRYDLNDPFLKLLSLSIQSMPEKETPTLWLIYSGSIPIWKNSWKVASLTESGGVTLFWNRSCCVVTPKMRLEFLTPKRIGTECCL